MKRSALSLGVLFSLVAAACDQPSATDAGVDAHAAQDAGSEDSSMRMDAYSANPLGEFCHPLAVNLCTSAMTCGCGDILPGGLDVAACTARYEAECMDAWQPFVLAGAIIDPIAAAACAATIEANSIACAAPSSVAAFALCAPFAIDPVGLGEDCAAPYCAGGSGYCAGNTCVRRNVVGESCDDMYRCDTGLVCNEGTCAAFRPEGGDACTSNLGCHPTLSCIDGTCEALRTTGADCTSTGDCARGLVCAEGMCAARSGTSCSEINECGNLAQCARPSSCRAPLSAGSTCVTNTDCAPSLYCADASKTCVARPAIGARCGNGVICAAGAGCDADSSDGICRALGAAGTACLFGESGPFLCAAGLACTDGRCDTLPTEGENCAGVDVCAPGLGCAFGPKGSICITPRTTGEPCENRQACRIDHYCSAAGTCQPDVAIGATCSPDFGDCGGACVPDASGGFTCRASLSEGATCLALTDCSEGLTCLVRAEDTRCIADICASL